MQAQGNSARLWGSTKHCYNSCKELLVKSVDKLNFLDLFSVYNGNAVGLVGWFVLLTTPGLSKDIRCHV